MLKVIFTNVVVSKGYDNAPAIRYSEKGDSVRSASVPSSMTPVQRTTRAGSISP